MLTAILFTVCLLVGVGLFIYQVWGRFNLLRAATGSFTVDRIPERLWAVVTIALGQKKFIRPEMSWVRETLAGWLHFFVFDEDRDHSFWMKNTLIPLDMFFIARDGTVVGIHPNATPLSTANIAVGKPSRYVLEVPGGWAARHGIAAGAQVEFRGVHLT